MGCDIHMWAEVRKSKNSPWEMVKDIFDDKYYDKEREIDTYNQPKTAEPYQGRNYDLFAILANVRNGWGFAGITTGIGFVPISMPKGIPKNATGEYLQEVNSWGEDGHSHSYLTLKELLDYDWNRTTVHQGYVKAHEYKIFKEKGSPQSWCGMAGGSHVEIISNEEMDKFILENNKNQDKHYYTQISWTESYSEAACFSKTLELLKTLVEDPENIRIVFFFDN